MEWRYHDASRRDEVVRSLEHLPVVPGTELTIIVYPHGLSGSDPVRMEINCRAEGEEYPILAAETFSALDEAMDLAPRFAKAIQRLQLARPDLHLRRVMQELLSIHLEYLNGTASV